MAKDIGDILTDEADSISLQRIDEADAIGRPDTIGVTYVESEYAALAEEQQLLHAAEGAVQARPHRQRTDELTTAAAEAALVVEQSRQQVEAARRRHNQAVQVLAVYRRRDRFAIHRYLLAWLILGLGDTAGILGAAIMLGEVPLIALGQALATGFAAVASGQAGADLKDLRLARQRQRDPEGLSDDEAGYRHLFTGMEAGVPIMRSIGWLSGAIVVIVSVGVGTLRWSVEGTTSGVAFGSLAAATALGSFLSTYSYTDDIADFLATTERAYRKAVTEHLRLADSEVTRQLAAARAAASSVTLEHQLRGLAARKRIEALGYRVLRRNPQVVGHGIAAEERVIGRRLSPDGDA